VTESPAATARQLLPELRPVAESTDWPADNWQKLVHAGVTGWMIPPEFAGTKLSTADVLDGCRELARANLPVTFILSQFQAACQRLVACGRTGLQSHWLPRLADGTAFGTVGISHLTTSRQHVTTPVVSGVSIEDGYQLDGVVPWVTGADVADVVLIGGTLPDGTQILAALPHGRAGVTIEPPARLLALSNARTASIRLTNVIVTSDEILAGPVPQVLSTLSGSSGGAGSLTTSALAVGHAEHAIDRLIEEAAARPALQSVVAALTEEATLIADDIRHLADGQPRGDQTSESLRTRATSLALRAAQAYLAAAKGAGYVSGHAAERLAREALFFLVWSCPQAVATQLLSKFSRCDDAGF
jgi:alkylation response protein AidB-like acyl-CoA dehydrogenase